MHPLSCSCSGLLAESRLTLCTVLFILTALVRHEGSITFN